MIGLAAIKHWKQQQPERTNRSLCIPREGPPTINHTKSATQSMHGADRERADIDVL